MVHPENPQERYITDAAKVMNTGNGICIFPTDTVYGMGTAVSNAKAIDRIGTILKKDKKRLFSFICSDFSQMSEYVKISNVHYKLMKRYLPGPYTFLLPATNFVPKKLMPNRKIVGGRIPANNITLK
jgi:tRNA threonylcarbamoyl adenosine modification protein (Sua5/YciO/YrdC/YwlC family)